MLFNVDNAKWCTLEDLSYYMNGSELDKVSEEKDLGIWISNHLQVSQQCVQAYSKAKEFLIEQ